MRTHLLLIIFALIPTYLFAQEGEREAPLSHHALGASASMLSGPGISYQYIFAEDQRIQLTGFAYYQKDGNNGDNMIGIIGAEYQHDIVSNRSTRFYGFLGGHYWYNRNNYSTYVTYDPLGGGTFTTAYTDKMYAMGGGVGIEVFLWRHITMNLDLDLLYRSETRTNYNSDGSSQNDYGSPSQYFGPGIGVGFFYRF